MKALFISICYAQNYQAKIWYDFTSPACPSSPLNHGYVVEGQLLLPGQQTTDACSQFLNQLRIVDKSGESSDSSHEEYSDYESSDDDDDDNDESDNNDEEIS